MQKTYIILVSIAALLISSCQSLKKEEPLIISPVGIKIGQWEAKAMIKSLETGEASVVSLDIIAQKPNPMRVEVTTSLGVALASILIKGEEIEYIIPKQKRYYRGAISTTSLMPVLKIKVDPRLLTAAFFEESYPNWDCQADNGIISTCSTPEGVVLRWHREDSASRRVSIDGPGFGVQLQIKKFIPKTEFPASALALKVPDSYKKYKLK